VKKTKVISIVVIIFIVILAVLFYNKSKLKAQATLSELSAYPVKIESVMYENISQPYILVGTLQAEKDVELVSESQGKVVKVGAKVGDYVNKNDVIIYIDDVLQKAAYQAAEVAYNKAKNDLQRYTVLNSSKSITDSQLEFARQNYETAEANYISAKRNWENTQIKSPISGIVTARYFDFGEYIKIGKPVGNVVNNNSFKITINVAEAVVFNLKKGDEVSIKVNVYPDHSFKGIINTISVKGDEAHKYPVEVLLNNSKEFPLRAGMFARVIFNSSNNKKTLLISRTALNGSIKDPSVFIAKNDTAKLVSISLGRIYDDKLEVLKGLKEGENVIVDGQSNLKDNYPIEIIK